MELCMELRMELRMELSRRDGVKGRTLMVDDPLLWVILCIRRLDIEREN